MHKDKLKIALFGNIYQEKTSPALLRCLDIMSKVDAEIVVSDRFYDFLGTELTAKLPHSTVIGTDFTADVVVCIGGDGTFLDVASRVGERQIPILGINTGRLGFLANFSADELEEAIESIMNGCYEVEERKAIQITCDELNLEGYPFALNEIAILKHDISSMITIHTSVGGEYLTTYQADGLIVGTPTGSTAYSLSVGGPIIAPSLDVISLTPVAPHSLNMRPILVGGSSVIDLCVESRSGSFLISLDGRSSSYRDNIHLHIRQAPYSVKVISHSTRTFFSTLRKKMMWGADIRQ